MNYIRLFIVLSLVFNFTTAAQPLQYPQTKKVNHIDTYFGVQVSDPYRWLENDTSKEVAEWVNEQNTITFKYFDNIPFRQKVRERLTKIWDYPKYSSPFRAGSNYFFYKNDGLQNQSVLYIQDNFDAEAKVFIDPNLFSIDGTISLAGLSFSKDGDYMAYSLSRSGSDWRQIFVMDVKERIKLNDELNWVKFSGMAWYKNGFYYSRYDIPKDTSKVLSMRNEYQKVYYHVLNTTQEQDVLIHEDKQNPLRSFGVSVSEDERFLFLSASESGKKGNAYYFRNLQANKDNLLTITNAFDDRIYAITNNSDKLILYTDKNAPNGKIIVIDSKNPDANNWKELIPEQTDVLSSVTSAGGKLFVTYMKDVSPRVLVYNLDGKFENEIPLPFIGMVSGFSGKKEDTFVFFTMSSFLTPAAIFRYDIPSKQVSLFRETEIDFQSNLYITKQVFYKSKDGTKIPMFITHRNDIQLNGTNPTLLYGYGGFKASMTPNFSVSRLIWLEQGGIYAVANLRGGGEYGDKWHQAGTKLNKQSVFDDFIAATDFLINEKYTSHDYLAIQGVSNGGLLIGAVINQRPDLFKVAIPQVGVMDMLRFHKFTIGWAWINDYGSSDDSVQFGNLYKYSPIHNIGSSVNYPAILVTTADHDDRVIPAHSFKYISTIQDKYKGKNPALIRIETKSGHGGGKPTMKIIEETADVYSFMFYNLGVIPSIRPIR